MRPRVPFFACCSSPALGRGCKPALSKPSAFLLSPASFASCSASDSASLLLPQRTTVPCAMGLRIGSAIMHVSARAGATAPSGTTVSEPSLLLAPPLLPFRRRSRSQVFCQRGPMTTAVAKPADPLPSRDAGLLTFGFLSGACTAQPHSTWQSPAAFAAGLSLPLPVTARMLVWLTRPRSAPTKTLPISAPSRASSSCRLSRRLVAGAGARLPSQPGAPLGPCSLPGHGSPRGLLLTSSFRPSASRFSVKMRVLSCAACHSPTVFGRPQGPHCQGPELALSLVAFSHVRQ